MAILLTNIGTSDLTIQIQINGNNYYLPIDYLPTEANIKKEIDKLNPELKEVWEKQRHYIKTKLYEELGFPIGVKQASRKLTEVLLEKYIENPPYWHPRLKPIRIWGAIQKSISLQANKAYIFVTDQLSTEMPNGHEKDTIHLYSILEKWLELENKNFNLEKKLIPSDVIGNEIELMLGYYYKALNQINITEGLNQVRSENEFVLISIKGSTPSMQTALQLQAIDSNFKNIVFLDPELSLQRILNGESSDCKLTLYWRHMRSQKYQTVRQLLNRWDFDGAIQVLVDWQKTLKSLPEGIVEQQDISNSEKVIKSVIKAFDITLCYLNLDILGARQLINSTSNSDLGPVAKIKTPNYDKLLNLYTLCKIYWELNQVTNFLPLMGSFCEETLHYLIEKLGGLKYFDKTKHPNDWYLDKGKIRNNKLWSYFAEAENNQTFSNWNFQKKPKYRLSNRISKWNFVNALIKFRDKAREDKPWQALTESLNKLDYWVDQRNDLIHSAEGVSKDSMFKRLKKDCENEEVDANDVCTPDAILMEMTNISRQTSELLNLSENTFIGLDKDYYIYSEVRTWVINKLMTDGLQ